MSYWLLKSEPETYSIDDLRQGGKTSWTGVRSYAARKNIQAMQIGDTAFFYHSGKNAGVVGEGSVVSLPYIETGDWLTVDIKFEKKFLHEVSREKLLQQKLFKDSILARQGRLSVQPVTEREAELIRALASRSE